MTTENQAPEGRHDLRTDFESWAQSTPPDERTNWEVFQAGARAALAAQPQAPVALTDWQIQAIGLEMPASPQPGRLLRFARAAIAEFCRVNGLAAPQTKEPKA
ncbi:MAG: hypothetical protein RL758_145 [Pseudomonadota bacterium]|jgi:hypothetical protein